MFIVAKLISFFTQPLHWIAVLMAGGLFLGRKHPTLGRRLHGCAFFLLLFLGWQSLPQMLIHHLETRHAEMSPLADLKAYEGVIVLGGATASGQLQQDHMQPLLNEAAERLTTPLILLHKNPHLRVLYTGGEGQLFGSGPSEADRAKVFFDSMGLPTARVEYESASRNTYENAIFTAKLPHVDTKKPWLLVTSAAHMPRSMATFSKAGWNVTAYPVDFSTGENTGWSNYSLQKGTEFWEAALHEYIGILSYKVLGRL